MYKETWNRLKLAVLAIYWIQCVKSAYTVQNLSFVNICWDANYEPQFHHIKEISSHHQTSALVKTKICLKNKVFEFCGEQLNMTYTPLPMMWTRTRDDQDSNGPDSKALYCAPPSIAALTDWFVIHPVAIGIFGTTLKPRTINVNLGVLRYFVDNILMHLQEKVVLVSTNNDVTIPFNVDRRGGLQNITDYWNKVVESPMIIHWFVENKACTHPKVSSLPIGSTLNMQSSHFPKDISMPSKRIPKMMVADKVHDSHIQWEDRRRSAAVCLTRPDVCVSMHGPGGGLAGQGGWLETISKYQFLAITHGGGLDPCPKLFESLMVGTIPIIERTALYDAYEHFPVVFVRNLTDFMTWPNASTMMAHWVDHLDKYYEPGSHLRNQTLHRLNTKYWYHLMESKLHNPHSRNHRHEHFQAHEFNDEAPFCEQPTVLTDR
eukprot:gene846-1647_t